MSDLDWWSTAVGASAAAIAVLAAIARGMRRYRRRPLAPARGERRIEIVAIDERKWEQ